MTDELGRSLVTLERTLVRSGALVSRSWRPGLDAETVDRLVGSVGLTASPELIEWFAWHDGAGDVDIPVREYSLFPGVVFYDLALLCKEYVDHRRICDEVRLRCPFPPSPPLTSGIRTGFRS